MEDDDAKKLIEEELAIAKRRLKASELLLSNDMIEDAINRVYYALFYAAKAMLNSAGFDAKSHSGLISEFGLRIVKPKLVERVYGKVLRKSFEARESSDYKIGAIFDKGEVKELISDAKKFIERAENFVKSRI